MVLSFLEVVSGFDDEEEGMYIITVNKKTYKPIATAPLVVLLYKDPLEEECLIEYTKVSSLDTDWTYRSEYTEKSRTRCPDGNNKISDKKKIASGRINKDGTITQF
jgi:hypothetical protein